MSERRIFKGAEFLIADLSAEDVFTPEDFSDEHRMILETARDFVENELIANIEKIESKDAEFMRGILLKAGELGFNGTDVPEEYDGLGLDKVSTTVVTEAIGGSGSFAVAHGAQTGIGTLPIVYFGTDEQKSKYLPGLASGELCGAYCLTEAGAGSDALNARTKAVLSEDGAYYVLNGEKMFITNAGWADTFIVYAKVDGEQFTSFIVERKFPGVSTGAEEKKMGIHGSSTRTVILEDVKVPVENVLYEVGQGHKVAFNVLNIGRWKLGAAAVGGAKRCIVEAAKYANGRVQFKTPISKFGLIRGKLADMAIKTYMAESMIYRTAGMFDDQLGALDEESKKLGEANAKAIGEYAVECSINKVYCSEILSFAVDEYVQILGGYGYVNEYPAERAYRDARINRIYEGTNEINRLLVTGTIMRRAMKGELPLMAAFQKLSSEIMEYHPLAVELPDTPLAQQEHMIRMLKKTALMTAGVAAQKYMAKLEEEQEVIALISDMIIEIFAMESGLLRAARAIEKLGLDKAAPYVAAVKVYVDDAVLKIETWAKKAMAHVEEAETLRTQLMAIKKLCRYEPVDAISLRRELAERITETERYPFELN
jgi:alkylation response protein AidB-like acyl-CoA dehydrogenase